jgi:8-oxo-dGTP pyrophosphatase MutT (NUDIX family)
VHGRYGLRLDLAEWPDGSRGHYSAMEVPDASVVVPIRSDLSTLLVRQWRHPWGQTSWEVPAGSAEPGEDAEACARRELAEEAGLAAARWTGLGAVRGSALLTNCQHLFLAEELTEIPLARETYERDMVLRWLPLSEAVAEALNGGIFHAASATALLRAASRLGLLTA